MEGLGCPICTLRVWDPQLWPFGVSVGIRETARLLKTGNLPGRRADRGLPASGPRRPLRLLLSVPGLSGTCRWKVPVCPSAVVSLDFGAPC